MFDCIKPEHAAAFERSLKRVVDYIRREGDKESVLVAEGLESFTTPVIQVPPMPPRMPDPDNPGTLIEDRGAMIMWEGELRHLPTQRNNLRNGLVQSYALLWNQCTPLMKSKLEQHPNFPVFDVAKDPIVLATEMRNIVCGREAHMQDAWSLCKLIKFMLSEWQAESETNEAWMERFHGMWEAVKQHGGSLWSHPSLIQNRAQEIAGRGNIATDAQTREAVTVVENEMKAMFMLAGGNKAQHESLRTALQNSYTVGRNKYPAYTTELLSMMNNWKAEPSGGRHSARFPATSYEDGDGLNFAQEGMPIGKTGESNSERTGVSMVQLSMKQRRGRSIAFRDETEFSSPSKDALPCDKPCVHCRGAHRLEACPEITDAELGKLMIQLGGGIR